MVDSDTNLQGSLGQPFTLNTGETSRVRVARGVLVEWLDLAGQISAKCGHLDSPSRKPVLAVRYGRDDQVALGVTPVLPGANFSLVRIELTQHHAAGGTNQSASITRTPFVGDPLSSVYKMSDLLDGLGTGVNQAIIEARVVLNSPNGQVVVNSLNTLHLVRQYAIVFLPGVAGAEIEVASHPGEFSYAAWSASFVPGTDEFRRLSCDALGNPQPGAQATKTQLLESFATQTVYDVRNRPELNTPQGHPRLQFLEGGRATGRALLYYKVIHWAYDWRLRLEFAVDWLLGKTPHPPQVGAPMPSLQAILADEKANLPFLADKAVLAGHSTGGVVMRGLLSKPESANLVQHAFFLNVPFFGAPKAYFVYLTGSILPFIANSLMREMAPHFPIVYYLAPTERFPDQVARDGSTPLGRSQGQNVGNVVIKPLIVRMGLSYPATLARWSDFLELRAREYHAAVTTPVIGWDNCTVFWGLTTNPETPGPVFVPFIGRGPDHDSIVGDGTVPEVSLKGDSPAGRQVRLPGNIEHVPAPNHTMVWQTVAQQLSSER
jgi:hypothetical protein